jgi:hypothetical protein
MSFDPNSEVGRRYLAYLENRARIWAEKYLDKKIPDYRGDYVLERYHFCNVWRELDRYSKWEISQIRGRPLAEQIDVIVVGRMTMIPATIRLLLSGAGRKELRAYRDERRAAGLPWYNGAIQIGAYGGRDYVDEFVDYRDGYFKVREEALDVVASARDAQRVATWFSHSGIYKVGSFRAYEIATSLTYSEHLPELDEAQLFMLGPGAVSGYNFITDGGMTASANGYDDQRLRPVFEALRKDVFDALTMRGAMRWIPPRSQGSTYIRRRRKFTLRTLEDSLCEFRKYWNIVTGITKARRKHHNLEGINV